MNTKLTPGGGLTGSGQRIKIAGETGDAVGFFFVKDGSQTSVAVPMTSVLRNDPSAFSLIIPPWRMARITWRWLLARVATVKSF